jgi:hypothetical protein
MRRLSASSRLNWTVGRPPVPAQLGEVVQVGGGHSCIAAQCARMARSRASGVSPLSEVDRGNHFAACQEPTLFTTEVRAAFRSLR